MALKGSGYFWSGLAQGLGRNVENTGKLWDLLLLKEKYDRMWDYKSKEINERGEKQKDILKAKQEFQKEYEIPLKQAKLDLEREKLNVMKLNNLSDLEKIEQQWYKIMTGINEILSDKSAIDYVLMERLNVSTKEEAINKLQEMSKEISNFLNVIKQRKENLQNKNINKPEIPNIIKQKSIVPKPTEETPPEM